MLVRCHVSIPHYYMFIIPHVSLFSQMPFTPKGDGHIDVETEEEGVKKTKRVQDPIPPRYHPKWHRLGEEGRWVYQYEDIESEQN